MNFKNDIAYIKDDERRLVKKIKCLHIQKIKVTMRCCECGSLNTVTVRKDELCPSVVDCLCISGRTIAS